MSRTRWNNRRWGVLFFGAQPQDTGTLIGQCWHMDAKSTYAGEPARALLFTSRREARAWCQQQQAKYAGRPDGCARWRFRPVRVRERVEVVR